MQQGCIFQDIACAPTTTHLGLLGCSVGGGEFKADYVFLPRIENLRKGEGEGDLEETNEDCITCPSFSRKPRYEPGAFSLCLLVEIIQEARRNEKNLKQKQQAVRICF